MTKEGDKPITGHLVYNYTPEIKKIFLREIKQMQYIVSKDGKKTPPQQVSKKLREILKNNGFDISEHEKVHLHGIHRYMGSKIDVSKIVDRQEIKQLLIRIHADNIIDLTTRIKTVQDAIFKEYRLKPDVQTYQKIERC